MDILDVTIAIAAIWLLIDVAVVIILFAAARRREEPLPQHSPAARRPSLRFARSRTGAERTRA